MARVRYGCASLLHEFEEHLSERCEHLCRTLVRPLGESRDTVETVSRVYAHWLRDDRDVPAAVLDRVLAPGDALRARDEASDAGS